MCQSLYNGTSLIPSTHVWADFVVILLILMKMGFNWKFSSLNILSTLWLADFETGTLLFGKEWETQSSQAVVESS